jgi:molybdopterin converting factor small subunit
LADDELKSPEVEESGQSGDRVTELEDLMAQKDEELAKANARIVELEQTVANLDSEVVSLKQALAESEERLTTIKAKTLVNRVKQGLEAEITAGKVPAGAPIRTPPDLSALSPREKINYAIGGKT